MPALSEVVVSDTAQFLGYSSPKVEASLATGFDLLNRRLRLSGLLDYKGGHKVYNNSERIRCASRFNCEGLISPDAPLYQQARTVTVREHPSRSVAGFIEPGTSSASASCPWPGPPPSRGRTTSAPAAWWPRRRSGTST